VSVSYSLATAWLYLAANSVLQCHKLQVTMSADNSLLEYKEQDENAFRPVSVLLSYCWFAFA